MSTKSFSGSIIITDPCYVDKHNKWWSDKDVDIFTGKGISKYGITDFLWESTGFGDWVVRMFVDDLDAGTIAADAGLVGVFYINELEEMLTEREMYTLVHSGLAIIVEDFDGKITIDDQASGWARISGKGSHKIKNDVD